MRSRHVDLSLMLGLALLASGCEKPDPMPPGDGGPGFGMKDVGEACASSEECLIADCFRGVCRFPCLDHSQCDWQMQGEICHVLSGTRGYCSLDVQTCDANTPCPDWLVCATDGRCRVPCSCEETTTVACTSTDECPRWQECRSGRCRPVRADSCPARAAGVLNVRNSCVTEDSACLEGACYETDERGIRGSNPGDIDSCTPGTERCAQQSAVVQTCNTIGQGWRLKETCGPATQCMQGCRVDAGPTDCPALSVEARCGCTLFCEDEKTLKSTCPPAMTPTVQTCGPGSVCVQSGIAGFIGSDAGCRSVVATRPLEPMVAVGDGGFSIDRTEVTRGQYAGFLLAKEQAGELLTPLPGNCVMHALDPLRPAQWPWFDAPDRAASTNFCAAKAYCEWAGRRLCGQPNADGGLLTPALLNDAGSDAWFAACSSGGKFVYQWGNTWDSSRCANADIFETGDMPVGSMPTCQSPEPGWSGVFDLSGNRAEWVDGVVMGSTGLAHGALGGPSADLLRCDTFSTPNVDSETFSFRCCSR